MKTRNKVALVAVAAMTATMSSAGIVGAQDDGEVKIAAVLKTLANPYWVAMADGIEAHDFGMTPGFDALFNDAHRVPEGFGRLQQTAAQDQRLGKQRIEQRR